MRVLLFLLLLASGTAASQGTVAVYVDDIRSATGDVVVRLYRSAEGFPNDRALAYREVRQRATGSTATLLIDDVPTGIVAVVAFHDEDRDGQVRLGPDGRPLDGVSAANWSGGTRPRFSDSALRVSDEGVTLARLRLWYPSDR